MSSQSVCDHNKNKKRNLAGSVIFRNDSTGCFEVVDDDDVDGVVLIEAQKEEEERNKVESAREMIIKEEEEKKDSARESDDKNDKDGNTTAVVIVNEETPLLTTKSKQEEEEEAVEEKRGKQYAATLITHGDDNYDYNYDAEEEDFHINDDDDDEEDTLSSPAKGLKPPPPPPKPKLIRQTSKLLQNISTSSTRLLSEVNNSTLIPILQKVEAHTKPIIDNINTTSAKFVNEKVAPRTSKLLQQANESTRLLTNQTKQISENVVTQTKQAADNVSTNTKQMVLLVKTRSQKLSLEVKQQSYRTLEHVSFQSQRALHHANTKVKPVILKQVFLWNGTAKSLRTTDEHKVAIQMMDGTMRSFGLVVCCDNPLSGLLIWLGMMFFFGSGFGFGCGFGALICAFLTNLYAYFINFNTTLIRHGTLSTNSVLIGSGLLSYLNYHGFWGIVTLIIMVTLVAPISSLLSYVVISNLMQQGGQQKQSDVVTASEKVAMVVEGKEENKSVQQRSNKVPVLLFPYVCTMMIIILCASGLEHVSFKSSILPPLVSENDIQANIDSTYQFMGTLFRGLSCIFIPHNPNIFSGCFIFVGMILCSRITAIAALIGCKLGAACALLCFDVSISTVNSGFMGFNVALTLMSMCYYVVPSWRTFVLGFLGLWLTLGLQIALMNIFSLWSIPIMVLPYCLSLLPFVAIDFKSMTNSTERPFVQTVPLDSLSTPEEHFSIFGKGAVVLPLVEQEEKPESCLPIKKGGDFDQELENEDDIEAVVLMKDDVVAAVAESTEGSAAVEYDVRSVSSSSSSSCTTEKDVATTTKPMNDATDDAVQMEV